MAVTFSTFSKGQAGTSSWADMYTAAASTEVSIEYMRVANEDTSGSPTELFASVRVLDGDSNVVDHIPEYPVQPPQDTANPVTVYDSNTRVVLEDGWKLQVKDSSNGYARFSFRATVRTETA